MISRMVLIRVSAKTVHKLISHAQSFMWKLPKVEIYYEVQEYKVASREYF